MEVLDAIFPIMVLLGLGRLLKTFNITNDAFLKTSDRLVYYIFFPAMLFWKIGGSPTQMDMAVNLCVAGIAGVATACGLSLFLIRVLPVPRYGAGSFSQACYRFNTYIGMAIVMNTLGEPGVRYFGILAGFAIPLINLAAVSTLIWYSGSPQQPLQTARRMGGALIANPLILACVAGLVFSRTAYGFPSFLDNTFSLMSSVTMPLALISIGGALTVAGIREHLRLSVAASLVKGLWLPVTGFICLSLFNVEGMAFQTGMLFFALPTSTALYVLSAQLGSDTGLASSSITVSTLFSLISLSAVILLFL
jgi:malonate transporter